MTLLVLCAVAAGASALTFLSGFGLGTILLPAFAWFYPIEQAVASTAIVHFLNGLFKLGLVGRHADRKIVLRFGVPAIAAALAGAWMLDRLAGASRLARSLSHQVSFDAVTLGAAAAAAFAGSWLGNRYLKKTTLRGVQRMVAAMLAIFAAGLVLGLL